MAAKPTRDEVLRSALRHRDALLARAYAVLLDWAAAEDVVQDALVVAMAKWEEFAGGSVSAWVGRIVQLKSLEALRARRRERPIDHPDLRAAVDLALDENLDDDGAEALAVRREALAACMRRLDPRSLDLLAGFYWRMSTCEALAVAHRRSVNAVRLALSKLRGRLRECLERRLTAGE